MKQEQFLDVVSRDEAERRFREALGELVPTGIEEIPIDRALGRVLAFDVASPVDVQAFFEELDHEETRAALLRRGLLP